MKAGGGDGIKEACITVLGSGHLRPAPGTWGSLVSVVVYAVVWWLLATLSAPVWVIEVVTLAGVLVASWLSVHWGEWATRHFGDSDPKPFVLDEFAGQWVALLWLPPVAAVGLWEFGAVVAGQFILFRILDILKPPPARWMERWPAGWGILCDDLIAGLYAALIGQLLWRMTPLATWLGLQGAT